MKYMSKTTKQNKQRNLHDACDDQNQRRLNCRTDVDLNKANPAYLTATD